MKNRLNTPTGSVARGFTLIELLVVISIIAILSSIVLAALSSARSNAKYAAVEEELVEMRNAYEIQYSSAGSYSALMPSRITNAQSGTYATDCQLSTLSGSNYCNVPSAAVCDSFYSGYQSDAICRDIMSNSGLFVFGNIAGSGLGSYDTSDYAFAVQNPTNPTSYFCIRSNGANTTLTTGFTNCITKADW